MTLGAIVIGLIVLCVLGWAARAIITATKTPEPLATILFVLVVLLSLVVVLDQVGAVNLGLRLR